MCTKAKEEYLEEYCKEIEELEKKDFQIMHDKVRHATLKKKKNLTGRIREDDGSILMDEESIRRRRTSYIKNLYSDNERKQKPEISIRMDDHKITTVEINWKCRHRV